MKSKWVWIEASIKKEEVAAQNTAKENSIGKIFLLTEPQTHLRFVMVAYENGVMCGIVLRVLYKMNILRPILNIFLWLFTKENI